MSIKENEAVIRKVYEEFNRGNYDVIDECFADDFIVVRHSGEQLDRDGFKAFLKRMAGYFPDIVRTVEDIVVSEDRGALFFTWVGTDTVNTEGGRTPTGRKIHVREIYFVRFKNGKISEYRQYGDAYGMRYQLGILPPIEEVAGE